MGLCQIFFKALLAGLTNQHDILDSFAVTPLDILLLHIFDANKAAPNKTNKLPINPRSSAYLAHLGLIPQDPQVPDDNKTFKKKKRYVFYFSYHY